MRIVRIPFETAPTEPVTLAEAKAQLRVTHDLEDALITSLIVAGREYAEAETRLSLVPSVWEVSLDDGFPCAWRDGYAIELPHPPLLEVVEVGYRDADDAWVVIDPDDYTVDLDSEPGVILPVTSWPAAKSARGNVRVRFRAGYGDEDVPRAIPEGIKAGILVYVAHRFTNREGGNVPEAVRLALYPYRFDL